MWWINKYPLCAYGYLSRNSRHVEFRLQRLINIRKPTIITSSSQYSVDLILSFCLLYHWDYQILSQYNKFYNKNDTERRNGSGALHLYYHTRVIDDGTGSMYIYGDRHITVTKFKLTPKYNWTPKIVRQSLLDLDIPLEVIIHNIYPFLPEKLYLN